MPYTQQELEHKMEDLHANFKLAPRVGYIGADGGGGAGVSGSSKYQGATFLGVIANKALQSVEEFNGKEFMGMDVFLICPLNTGRATAPYTYRKSSKNMDAKALAALNKNGSPLTAWADTNNSVMRFWSWAKVGFNRGNRNEKVTWEYGGGDTFTFWVEPKDFEQENSTTSNATSPGEDKPISFYIDGKKPANPILDMDLVRICLMPKSSESLAKTKKTCFAFKVCCSFLFYGTLFIGYL